MARAGTRRWRNLWTVWVLVLIAPAVAAQAPPLGASPEWTGVGEFVSSSSGYSVATAGDVNGDGYDDVIVTATDYSSDRGRAYVYLGSATGLATTAHWTGTGASAGDHFGYAVSTLGDVNGDGYDEIVVGTPFVNGALGEVYVYYGSSTGLSTTPDRTYTGVAGSRVGTSVACAGDVNDDGYDDLLVGHAGNTAASEDGRVIVYLGGPGGLASTPVWTALSENVEDYFGGTVDTAGDVNGDGYSDVIIGAYAFDGIAGKAYVYLGNATGLESTPIWTGGGPSGQGQIFYAWVVSTAGDVNDDGYDDVMTGAVNLKEVYIYEGGPSGPDTAATWTLSVVEDSFGYDVAAAGDVNGDGYDDILVPQYTYAGATGRVRAYLGQATGPDATSAWTEDGPSAGSSFGISAASAGDVNGDGATDIVVGAPSVAFSGEAYVYHGTPAVCGATRQEVVLPDVDLDVAGKPVLTIEDPNAPACVTGYNIYRASNPAGPWTLIGSDVQDMDPGSPGIQYVDPAGDVGQLWYYEVAAWDGANLIEGPY